MPDTAHSAFATATPRVTVVIVNANAGRLIEQTLSSLAEQTLQPPQIIVVDNASSDGSAEAIEKRHPGVEVVRLEKNIGFAAANNLAVKVADGCEWVALLNPDAFPEPAWLEALVGAAQAHRDYSFFASRQLRATAEDELDGTGDVYHVSGLAWRRDYQRPASKSTLVAGEIFSSCAAAAMYRRDAFLEVGGFDESYFAYFEDSDLAFRLRLKGHRCWYVPDAVVRHVGSSITGSESDFTIYHAHRNLVWTYVKNMPWPLAWIYLPEHLLLNILTVVFYSLRGRGKAILSAKRDALRGLPRVLRQRRAIQGKRTVGALELRRVMGTGFDAYVATSVGRSIGACLRKLPGQHSLRGRRCSRER